MFLKKSSQNCCQTNIHRHLWSWLWGQGLDLPRPACALASAPTVAWHHAPSVPVASPAAINLNTTHCILSAGHTLLKLGPFPVKSHLRDPFQSKVIWGESAVTVILPSLFIRFWSWQTCKVSGKAANSRAWTLESTRECDQVKFS